MGWTNPPIPSKAGRARRAVCAVLRAEAHAGADLEMEGLLADFARHVRDEEPGCLSYIVTRALGSRTQFVAHALFVDWSGFRAHGETEHLDRLLPMLTPLMAAPVSVEIFLEVERPRALRRGYAWREVDADRQSE
jgi:quinol monooxygenase YgiN